LRLSKTSILIITLLAAGMILGPYEPRVPRTYGASVNAPTVGVWSNDCGSFNISIASCPSGFLNVGNTITVQVNLTNAAVGTINGYEFFLYYDPSFLNATGFDATTNTVFSNPFVGTSNFAPVPGTVHMEAVCFGCSNTSTNGALVNINFKILAVGVSPLTLATGLISSGFAQSFTELTKLTANGVGNGLAPVTADGYFKNENANLGPVASFSFLPASPKIGQQVTFYANASYDPDAAPGSANNGIRLYIWDFGGSSSVSTTAGSSVYSFKLGSIYGNFSVRLTVVDADNNFEGMKTKLFTISQIQFHDLIAYGMSASPNPANLGDKVNVGVVVLNNGSSPENFNLAVSYSYPFTIFGLVNQSVVVGGSISFMFTLDTSKLAPGSFYTLTANVTVLSSPGNPSGIDNIPANNIRATVLDVLPPPTPDFSITANPSSLMIQAGRNGTSTITLTSIAGFSGSIALFTNVFPVVNGTSPVATLQPTRLQLSAGGTTSSTLTISTFKNTLQNFYNIVVNATSGTLSHWSFIGVEIVPPPDLPPVANFTFSPPSPVTGQVISFDGTSSFDPDGSVVQWFWNFGDGSFLGFGSFTSHTYSSIGIYTVILTVRDNAGLSASKSFTLQIRPRPLHDVSIAQVQAYPNIAVSSQFVFINIEISNDGLNNETVSLTAYYDSHPIQTLTKIFVPLQNCNQFFCQSGTYVTITWDTTGVAAGNYTISATVFLAPGETDPTPSDNSLIGNKITILPPPVLTVTPISGGVGTKVLVRGSGFLTPQFFFFSSPSVDVTFDDQFIGFTITNNGSFNFTFDIPDAQPGPHLVKAIGFDGIHASTAFQVLPTAGGLSVSVNTGAVYFPGDTATIYVLATSNGTPLSTSGFQLQLGLFLPNGTKVTLSAIPITPGLFKATYKIPKTGPLGTYAVVATGQASGGADTSALASFEVKLSWLSSQSQNIIGATTLAGVVGLVAVAWRKGYLRRKDEN
jgi:PKD repeat protein